MSVAQLRIIHSKYNTSIRELGENLQKTRNELRSDQESRLEQLKEDYDQTVKELESKYTCILNEDRTKHEKEVKALVEARTKELAEIKIEGPLIVFCAIYRSYDKSGLFVKYLTHLNEALRLRQEGDIDGYLLEKVDFYDINQINPEQIEWIDDGQLHQAYFLPLCSKMPRLPGMLY